jgi:hypothetical protein
MRRAAIHLALLGSFFFALTLSSSPALHERFHPDARLPGHECAVTVIASGSYVSSAPPPVVVVALPRQIVFEVARLSPIWISSLFSESCVFEHAPPATA